MKRTAVILFSCLLVLLPGCVRPGGIVVADHPLAAEAGARMLRAGGNAVDAAVATSLALSVVRPDACGIGGGGFMVMHFDDDPTHGTRSVALNYRETCPGGIGPESYARWGDPEASQRGGRAVAVPGTIAGLLHALDRYGTLDRSRVFAPAIEYAERGFEADEHHVRTARSLAERFREREDWRRRFPLVWNRFMARGEIRVGDRIHLPEQARALRLIAEEGRSALYAGPIAQAIVAATRDDGGVLTLDDLASYRVQEVEPVRVTIDGVDLLLMPPPSSGGVAIAQFFALATALDVSVPASGWYAPDEAHLLVESFKHVFADRSRTMADPAFHEVPVDAMLSADTIDGMARSVRPERTLAPEAYGSGEGLAVDGGTSHISVVDGHGNAVACTETINLAFGSMVGVDGFGFCLNDQMDDFTTIAGEANAFGLVQSDANLPEPGKRPLSSMSPTIAIDRDGRVLAVAGASGGPRIISSTAQVLLRMLRGGASPGEAVNAPRLHHQWLPDRVLLERDAPGDLVARLESLGHAVGESDGIGAVQAIKRSADGARFDGAADPRKGGASVRP